MVTRMTALNVVIISHGFFPHKNSWNAISSICDALAHACGRFGTALAYTQESRYIFWHLCIYIYSMFCFSIECVHICTSVATAAIRHMAVSLVFRMPSTHLEVWRLLPMDLVATINWGSCFFSGKKHNAKQDFHVSWVSKAWWRWDWVLRFGRV